MAAIRWSQETTPSFDFESCRIPLPTPFIVSSSIPSGKSTMNTIQAALHRDIQEEIKARGGVENYRAHVLQHLQLKTVESHNTPVIQLSFNHSDASTGNLVATVGSDQATVYDDLHMGDHVSVVVQFTNQRTDHNRGGALRAVGWVASSLVVHSPAQDAWLAVAGCDHVIQVISVARSQVIFQLHGHTSEVVDLCGVEQIPLLLSLSCDGCIRLWDVITERCLIHQDIGAHTVELGPGAVFCLSGHTTGEVKLWYLTHALAAPRQCTTASTPAPSRTLFRITGEDGSPQVVDSLELLAGGCRVAVKTAQGCLSVWQLEGSCTTPPCPSSQHPGTQEERACQCLWRVTVPEAATSGAYPSRCLLSKCKDGRYLCCGNTVGRVYVYDSETGNEVCVASADKVEAPVRACGLSEDCRHLWAVLGNGFIFRFEYVAPAAAAPDTVTGHAHEGAPEASAAG